MIAVSAAVIGVGLLYNWWNQDEEPARLPPVPPPPRTEAEKLERVITAEARKRIAFIEERPLSDISSTPPKMQMLCTLSQPYSWKELKKELSVFCQTSICASTEAEKRVFNWAKKTLEAIEELNKRHQAHIECTSGFIEKGEKVKEQLEVFRTLINAQGNKTLETLQAFKESDTSSLEYKVYKAYLDALNKINAPDRISDLFSFITTESPMFSSDPVVEVVTSQRTEESDKSEEERLKKLLKEQKSLKAMAVFEATKQNMMMRTAFIPKVVLCPKNFTYRTEVPTSAQGESFRKAIEGTCTTLNKEAEERRKAREAWPYKEGGSKWQSAPTTKQKIPVFKGNILTKQMDQFLESAQS